MISVNRSSATLNAGWFDIKGPYAIVKEEYRDEMLKVFAAKKEQGMNDWQMRLENAREKSVDVVLTDEQKKHLSDTYNPQNMTHEDYQAFLDDLCQFGILEEADKKYLTYNKLGLTPLEAAEPSVQISTIVPGKSMFQFSDCNGNVMEWAKYRASYETFDSLTQSFQKTTSAILFGKIENVFSQLLHS